MTVIGMWGFWKYVGGMVETIIHPALRRPQSGQPKHQCTWEFSSVWCICRDTHEPVKLGVRYEANQVLVQM